jgi:TolA-binding protein
MKTSERHRLKENELAHTVAQVKETVDVYRKPIIAGVVALVVVVAGVVGFVVWRQNVDGKARTMLAEAMIVERAPVAPPAAPGATTPPVTPPGGYPTERARNEAALQKFMAVANAYPSSTPGITARYHAATLLAALGRDGEAVQRYQEVIDRAGSSIYGEMSKLGIADAEAAMGQYDKAIAAYKDLATRKEAQLPMDGVLMQLGRTYEAAGKTSDARQTFERIVNEFPQSPYAAVAKREMEGLKG